MSYTLNIQFSTCCSHSVTFCAKLNRKTKSAIFTTIIHSFQKTRYKQGGYKNKKCQNENDILTLCNLKSYLCLVVMHRLHRRLLLLSRSLLSCSGSTAWNQKNRKQTQYKQGNSKSPSSFF